MWCGCKGLNEFMSSRQYADMYLRMQIDPAEIEFCRHSDGSLWELGSGGYGHVSAHVPSARISVTQKCILYGSAVLLLSI